MYHQKGSKKLRAQNIQSHRASITQRADPAFAHHDPSATLMSSHGWFYFAFGSKPHLQVSQSSIFFPGMNQHGRKSVPAMLPKGPLEIHLTTQSCIFSALGLPLFFSPLLCVCANQLIIDRDGGQKSSKRNIPTEQKNMPRKRIFLNTMANIQGSRELVWVLPSQMADGLKPELL